MKKMGKKNLVGTAFAAMLGLAACNIHPNVYGPPNNIPEAVYGPPSYFGIEEPEEETAEEPLEEPDEETTEASDEETAEKQDEETAHSARPSDASVNIQPCVYGPPPLDRSEEVRYEPAEFQKMQESPTPPQTRPAQ